MGCGWLGAPLGKRLLNEGYQVKGTTTSSDKLSALSAIGITPFLVQIQETEISGHLHAFLKNLDILILNIPPRLRNTAAGSYIKKMNLLLDHMKNIGTPQLLFVSSTSIYGRVNGKITEDTSPKPVTVSGKELLQTETLFTAEKQLGTTIIRFGGLIGGKRHPVFQLSGRTGLKNGAELINLIHRDDCIHMISTILKYGYWNEVFNGVYPYHPPKREYYVEEAVKRKLPVPVYDPNEVPAVSKKHILSQNFFVKKHQLYTSIVS